MRKNTIFYWFIGSKKIEDTYYRELIGRKDVVFIYKDNAFTNPFMNFLFKIFFSQKVNSRIRMPFKKSFFKCLLKNHKIENKYTSILIFHEGWFDKDISVFLRKNFNLATSILYFDDTIETYSKAIPSLNPLLLNSQYNFVLVYNPEDAQKYGFIHVDACFSRFGNLTNEHDISSDICFIGQPKDRLSLLLDIHSYLCNKCKCDFVIVDKSNSGENGLEFTTKYMTYEDYLKREVSSNCILELLKSDTGGSTFRCWEAVYYNKKLLTNWKGIFSFKYYDSRYMRYFEKPEDIDIAFLTTKERVDYHYNGDNSPSSFLERIIDILNKGKV